MAFWRNTLLSSHVTKITSRLRELLTTAVDFVSLTSCPLDDVGYKATALVENSREL